jgi:hypothetical protein
MVNYFFSQVRNVDKSFKNSSLSNFILFFLKFINFQSKKKAGKSDYPIFPLENKYKGNLGGC